MKLKAECSMEIYKYTSMSAAIAILKSGGVALSDPKEFNDPNDCSFVQSQKDKEKIEKLVTDYFVYKVLCELVSLNKITLDKKSRMILSGLQKEMVAMKWILNKYPYFGRILGFNRIANIASSRSEEFLALVEKAKKVFQNKIDKAVEDAKDSALVSCFSKRKNSMLMWSHYANSHKGVCIEYERPESKDFRDVIYQNKRPFIKMYKAVSHAIALDILQKNESESEIFSYLKDTLDPFFIKATDWKYEDEVRCLYSKTKLPDNVEYDGNRYILNIGYPKAIYIGCRAAGEGLNHLYRLAENRGIPVYFMKKSEKTFDIIVDKGYKYEPGARKPTKEVTLLRLIDDINYCLNHKAYLAAFAASLIVPAICSQVECATTKPPKDRYIEWCNTYLPCDDRGPDDAGTAYLTGEILWNIKEKLFSEGNIEVSGSYEDFYLKKVVLRIEERNAYDIYCDLLDHGDVTANVTKLCSFVIYEAQRCYEKHRAEIESLVQLQIEDYDAELESMHECAILNERLNRRTRGNK